MAVLNRRQIIEKAAFGADRYKRGALPAYWHRPFLFIIG